ncbi:MAG: Na+/H+ antiporter subunit E [Lysobacteraceae bacterium]|nr:MAG: Na+/H+ antiporter subunit E [Xanthomonadaceae bacterium]
MNLVLLTILIALGWCAATASFSLGNLLFGALLAGAALYFARGRIGGAGFWRRSLAILALIWLFIRELMVSAVKVGILVLRPDLKARLAPRMIAFPLSVESDIEITLLANLITLTPGTLSVDVSEDRKLLHIHAIDAPDADAVIEDIRDGFERAVARACR